MIWAQRNLSVARHKYFCWFIWILSKIFRRSFCWVATLVWNPRLLRNRMKCLYYTTLVPLCMIAFNLHTLKGNHTLFVTCLLLSNNKQNFTDAYWSYHFSVLQLGSIDFKAGPETVLFELFTRYKTFSIYDFWISVTCSNKIGTIRT